MHQEVPRMRIRPTPAAALLALFVLALLAVADENSTTFIRSVCGGVQAKNPQPFDVNFVDAMETISQNISGVGFAVAVSGADPSDRVYGLGQCFNYLSPTDCGLCYAQSRVRLPQCLPSNSARVYLNGCFLRYGNYNFSRDAADSSDESVCEKPTGAKEANEFRETAVRLIGNLTGDASEAEDYYKQGNASSSSSRFNIYGIAACWRSLNRSGCRECLKNAKNRVLGCLPASDGKALNAGCFVRYSLEPFFAAPSPSSSKSSSGALSILSLVSVRRRLAAGLGASFAAVAVIVVAILWRKKRSSNGNDKFA